MADGRANDGSLCCARYSLRGVDKRTDMTRETFPPSNDCVGEGEGIPVENYIKETYRTEVSRKERKRGCETERYSKRMSLLLNGHMPP
jgi:hypothetical protein